MPGGRAGGTWLPHSVLHRPGGLILERLTPKDLQGICTHELTQGRCYPGDVESHCSIFQGPTSENHLESLSLSKPYFSR